MKITLRSPAVHGSVLVLTVVVVAIVGFALASYLSLVQNQNVSTARSQAWNSTVPLIEAGIEDALTHLNVHGSTNLGCDGWTEAGSFYCVKRPLGDGYYISVISNWSSAMSNSSPVVYSRGYVNAPLVAQAGATPAFLADSTAPSGTAKLARGVRITTRPQGLFTKAMVAKGKITFSGNAGTDSFNSDDAAFSTDGLYDPDKARDKGDVATNGQLVKDINASGEVKIKGHVSTGPGGTVGFTGNSSIGSKNWVESGTTGIEGGWFTDDMNVNFSDVGVPFTGGYFTPGNGKLNGTNYSYLLTSDGNYQITGNLSLSGMNAMMISGNVVLYVTGSVSLSGQSFIAIAPGASLKIYVGGSASLSGLGVANGTGNAKNFNFYGLPSCTSVNLSGNSAFLGIIYAPSAAFNLSGGGTDAVDFIGSSITKTVNMSGNYMFHYDESLANWGPSKGFTVTSWNELTPTEVGALPSAVAAALGLQQ
jgi:hypothetical protein